MLKLFLQKLFSKSIGKHFISSEKSLLRWVILARFWLNSAKWNKGNQQRQLINQQSKESKKGRQKERKRLVKLNTVSLYNNIKNSKINVNAAYKEYNAAKLALNGIKKEEEFGLRTLLDVLDSEVDVMDAEVKVLKSKSDQVLSKYKLLIDIGKFKI